MKAVVTDKAPAAIGPYSQAMVTGKLMFTSGQIPLRVDGSMVEGDVSAQAHQVLSNLKALAEAEGASLSNVVKTTVFLQDLADFAAMNIVYEQFFGQHRPARSTIQIARLPRDAAIEIEAVIELS